MWIYLWIDSVTQKPQNVADMRAEPQDVVHALKFVPHTDALFRAKLFKILDRVRVRLAEVRDPVHKGDHDPVARECVFIHIGQRDRLAQVHHVLL